MTEQIHDQISAFIDDELSEQESAFLVRRLERDADARNQALRYSLIGSALRGELLQPHHDILRRRIQSALNGGTVVAPVASRTAPVRRLRYLRPVVGFGIAATVAVAAVVGLRTLNNPVGEALVPVAATTTIPATQGPVQARQWTEPASYVVPQDVPANQQPTSPIRLTNYLVRHGEYASGLGRTSVHSSVVGAAETFDRTLDESLEQVDEPQPQTLE